MQSSSAPPKSEPAELRAERLLPFAAFLILWACRANFYDGDGLRYAVWSPSGISWFSSSNHAITPVWLKLWWFLVGNFVPDNFDAQVRATQVFNHACGGVSAYLVARIVRLAGGVSYAGIAAAGILLGTWAFLYHSTHFSEPMIGLVLTLFAWERLIGTGPPGRGRVILSAIAYATAAASYQTFFFVAPALLLAVGTARGAALWCVVAAVSGFVLFTGAAVGEGAGDLASLIAYARGPLDLRGAGVYWGVFKPERLFQAALGSVHMILALYRQLEWAGFRRSFGDLETSARLFLLSKVVLATAGLLWTALQAWRFKRDRTVWTAVLLMAPMLFLIAYWDPYYLKLWLAPAAALAVVAGLGIRANRVRWLAAAACLIFAVNYGYGVTREQSDDNLQARTTRVIEETVGPNDLLIGDAWSVLSRYFSKHARDRSLYSVTTAGDDPGLVRLREKVAQTRSGGGRVYLYGILNTSDQHWSESVGLIGGLPREVRDQWTARSRLVWSGKDRNVPADMYELVGEWP